MLIIKIKFFCYNLKGYIVARCVICDYVSKAVKNVKFIKNSKCYFYNIKARVLAFNLRYREEEVLHLVVNVNKMYNNSIEYNLIIGGLKIKRDIDLAYSYSKSLSNLAFIALIIIYNCAFNSLISLQITIVLKATVSF